MIHLPKLVVLFLIAILLPACAATAVMRHPETKLVVRCSGGDKEKQQRCIDEYQKQGFVLGADFIPVAGFNF